MSVDNYDEEPDIANCVTPVCKECGSTEVFLDALAEWDFRRGEWVLSSTYDHGYCRGCDADDHVEFKWVPTHQL